MKKIGICLATVTAALCAIAFCVETANGATAKLGGHESKPIQITQFVFDPTVEAERARQGDVITQLRLGHHYLSAKNYTEALKWFQMGADAGYAPAVVMLGAAYENGWGVTQDFAKALQLYQEAAAGEYMEAKCAIGKMHHAGKGFQKNDAEAAKFWQIKNYPEIKQRAESGEIESQVSLAEMYLQSPCRYFPQLTDEAMKWYELAAKAGDKQAQQKLQKIIDQRESSAKWGETRRDSKGSKSNGSQ